LKNLKKIGMLSLSTALTFGIFSPMANASSTDNKPSEYLQVRVSSSETTVEKADLIKKFKSFFPSQFYFLTDKDFQMHTGHRYSDDDTIRYELNFYKTMNGKTTSGFVGFVGEDLEMENFHYNPINSVDALFPAKVSKDEAKKLATAFVNRFDNGKEYVIEENSYYFPRHQTLTEPINYNFAFISTKNNVKIPDQRIEVTILGNGDVVGFYRNTKDSKKHTFDKIENIKSESDILGQIRKNLDVDLQYYIEYDYQTGGRDVKLIYNPTSQFTGVHAVTGDWNTMNGYSKTLPEKKKVELLSAKPIPPLQTKFTTSQAKAFAEKLLAVNSDNVKLRIESVEEQKNHIGRETISIQYMYEYASGGHGTSLELDKNTGEIIQYHNILREVLDQVGDSKDQDASLSREQAINKAVEYLKQYSPSYLHHYSMPIEEYVFEDNGDFHFSFPRLVNGIMVAGDQISVIIAPNGDLINMHVGFQEVESWPSSTKIISSYNAKTTYQKALELDLQYVMQAGQKENHYDLIYKPSYNDSEWSLLDANTGEWISLYEQTEPPTIKHPWAEEELNYLLAAKILNVKDLDSFDASESVTKGEALEVVTKSLTHFYEEYPPRDEEIPPSFENIDAKHPLFQVVERAVSLGILDKGQKKFDVDEELTREELAVWYIRALGLEQAAKFSDIYKLEFADGNKVNKSYYGHVALAHSLGLLTADQNRINPNQEVDYAQLAVSTIRLAHKAYENGRLSNYYY
jgi:hypothetical protein